MWYMHWINKKAKTAFLHKLPFQLRLLPPHVYRALPQSSAVTFSSDLLCLLLLRLSLGWWLHSIILFLSLYFKIFYILTFKARFLPLAYSWIFLKNLVWQSFVFNQSIYSVYIQYNFWYIWVQICILLFSVYSYFVLVWSFFSYGIALPTSHPKFAKFKSVLFF